MSNLVVPVPVLPKFEVSIVHPGPVSNDAAAISWKVCAQYVVNFYFRTDSVHEAEAFC